MAKASRERKPLRKSTDAVEATGSRWSSVVWNRILFAVALFGVLLAVHLWIQTVRGFEHGCLGLSDAPTTAAMGCTAVAESGASEMMGVSNVVWGFLFFLIIASLSFARAFVSESTARLLKRFTFLGVGVAFLYSVYLVLYQAFAIEEFCPLCLTSAGTVTVLLALSVMDSRQKGPAGADVKQASFEIGYFALASFVGLALVVAIVFFVNRVGIGGQDEQQVRDIVAAAIPQYIDPQFLQAAAPCTFATDLAPLANVDDFIFPEDQYIGSEEAPVRVIKFFDPNCPHCKTLHEVMRGVYGQNAAKARFYFRPFPIWGFSTPQVQALYLAREEGKFYEMMDAQFERQKQGGLSQNELVEIADEIGLDVDRVRQGLRDSKYLVQIQSEKDKMLAAGVSSLPKLAIDGKFVPNNTQSMSQPCINGLINQEYVAHARAEAAAP